MAAVVTAALTIGLYAKVAVWNECRAGNHSWLYCVHLINN